jgi:hypothetical protein
MNTNFKFIIMKKRNLISLKLNKKVISLINQNSISGGAANSSDADGGSNNPVPPNTKFGTSCPCGDWD